LLFLDKLKWPINWSLSPLELFSNKSTLYFVEDVRVLDLLVDLALAVEADRPKNVVGAHEVILKALEKAVPYRRQNFENNDILEIALIQTSLAVLVILLFNLLRFIIILRHFQSGTKNVGGRI